MWRDIGRQLRFFGLDGRAIFLIVFWLYHPHMWTFYVLVGGMVVLWLIERRGYTLANAWRKVQVFIAGPKRPAVAPRRQGRSDR